MAKRPVPERAGEPICAVDLGGSRAWSAALVIYPSGRVECRAVAPGIPNLEEQEKRDRVPRGTYQALKDEGTLVQAAGLRVPPASLLVEQITKTWGRPSRLVCDRFRVDELRDVGLPCRLESRVTRWSEAAYDIRSLRKATQDGPFAVAPDSRSLLEASLAVAAVRSDDQGSVRLIKRTRNNESRDDVASAFALARWRVVKGRQHTGSHPFEDTVLNRPTLDHFLSGFALEAHGESGEAERWLALRCLPPRGTNGCGRSCPSPENRSTMVARCFSLKTSNLAAGFTMSQSTAERLAKKSRTGRTI